MRVFHGSYTAIDKINLSKCQPKRDFGQGFYVTKIRSQAEYWAKRKDRKTKGVVTEFDFHEYAYRYEKLKLLRFDGYSEEWLDFIMLNRANEQKEQAHDYDIVEGPVADDAVTRRIFEYLREDLTKRQFLEELKFKKPTHQICFCTVQALLMLTFINDGVDGEIIYTDDDVVETLMEEFGWTEEQATDKYYLSETHAKFVDESTGLYQKPWREIYELFLQELNLIK
ncbi:MAG: DUF3990 domain-containing protein [Bacteroidales bacterium]|jgi:hypothetical protein|nr:DUF3990 domain-containing protein [Bacteroidales bacterium]